MIRAAHMLMIGATGRKVGKTTLVCKVLNHFSSRRHLVGVKVTTCHPEAHGDGGPGHSLSEPFVLSEERTEGGEATDTQRMLDAGAQRVFWLRVQPDHLEDGARALLDALGEDQACVCESNSLRRVLIPGAFVQARGDDPDAYKESALRVRPMVDRLVSKNGRGFKLDELTLDHAGWSMPVSAGGVILAGGYSRRMGTDKSMLPIGGQPLIARVAEQLTDWLDGVVVSTGQADKYSFLGLPIVVDRQGERCPLMGIASALAQATHEFNLVVACDIPIVDRALARELLARCQDADIAIPVGGTDLYEPLFAVYRRSLAQAMFEMLAAGQRRIVSVFDRARVEYVRLLPGERVMNLNTMDDYQQHLAGL